MKVYDFDGTIYDGDSSIDFLLFVLGHNIRTFVVIPHIFVGFIKYFMKKISKKELKEIYFSFLQQIECPEETVKYFVEKNRKKVKKWYKQQMMEEDVIITASPEFLVSSFMEKLVGQKCIGTRMDIKTGRIFGENCYGSEKVLRYREKYGNRRISEFYTDSASDMPMMEIAEQVFMIKKECMIPQIKAISLDKI